MICLRSFDLPTSYPGSLYSVCNVNLPKECNNSPLTRQASDDEASGDEASIDDTLQCISDRLDAVIQGNPSFVLDCISTGILESKYMSEMPANQTICNTECGGIILEVYSDCGFFDYLPGSEKLFIDSCGTN